MIGDDEIHPRFKEVLFGVEFDEDGYVKSQSETHATVTEQAYGAYGGGRDIVDENWDWDDE